MDAATRSYGRHERSRILKQLLGPPDEDGRREFDFETEIGLAVEAYKEGLRGHSPLFAERIPPAPNYA